MNKLWVRLSLGFSATVLAAVFIMALAGILIGGPERRSRPVLTGLTDQLAAHYQARHSWAGSELLLSGAQTAFGQAFEQDSPFFLADAGKRIVYHPRADRIGRPLDQVPRQELVPIQVEGQTVGYLGYGLAPPRRPGRPPGFVGFLAPALLTTAAAVGASGIVFGILMSRSLTAPLNNLAQAAQAIGARDLNRRVEEKGTAEMRTVARAFNDMAGDLAAGERLRRNLLADVAHELRTPLSVLQGNLRAILDGVYPLDQEEMARLYDQTRFLTRLVNDLHELAQAEAHRLPLDRRETDLAHLVRTTTENFRPAVEEKGIALHLDLPGSLPPVLIDPARLTQVLQNLLANALRHTPPGETITLRLGQQEENLLLTVADSGEGIPPEHLPHIFDRFYRTDPARRRDRGGSGLGLAIARAIVEAHGGQIGATSAGQPGQGSTFTIQLPVADNV